MGKRGRRRRYSASEKVSILKRHLVEREEVSRICEDLKIHPNQFYEWQKLFFENGVKAFDSEERREEVKLRERVSTLEAKLQRKDSVLSELMEEHVALKKSLGET
jgi:transposase-like protein